MENFQKYLSTAPVLLTVWMTFTAGLIIEINRFFPDMLGLKVYKSLRTYFQPSKKIYNADRRNENS